MAGSKPFDRAEQAEVALLDQVLQAQALAGVAAGDVDHQAQVGADHAVAGLDVALADGDGQFLLVVGREQRRFVDLPQVRFQRRLDGREGRSSLSRGHVEAYRQWSWNIHPESTIDAAGKRFCNEARASMRWGECARVSGNAEENGPAGMDRRGRDSIRIRAGPAVRLLVGFLGGFAGRFFRFCRLCFRDVLGRLVRLG